MWSLWFELSIVLVATGLIEAEAHEEWKRKWEEYRKEQKRKKNEWIEMKMREYLFWEYRMIHVGDRRIDN